MMTHHAINQSEYIQNAIMIHYDSSRHHIHYDSSRYHHHVNINGNDSSRLTMTHQDKQLCKTMTHHQDLCNVTIKTAHQNNNSKIVQGPLLLHTVSLLAWLQYEFNTKYQKFKIVARSYQHKIPFCYSIFTVHV